MSERLESLVEATRARLEERKRARPPAQLEREAADRGEPRGFRSALREPGISLVAEYKRRSPSAGEIRPGASVTEVAQAYATGGATALSILTEWDHFGGSLDDVHAARRACPLPILRKDFTVDPYQLFEARLAGADAVLLVVGSLPQGALRELHAAARELALDALVEVHDRGELERALDVDAELIGINNRDLTDFSVDLSRTFELAPAVPPGRTVVSESGIFSHDEVERLDELGLDAVLVGEALMRAEDPQKACRTLLGTEAARA